MIRQWTAKIAGDGDHYSMTITFDPTIAVDAVICEDVTDTVTLWSGKTLDEAMRLLIQFQRDNDISDNESSALIDIAELI